MTWFPHLPAHPGGPQMAAGHPLAGLAAYGVPISVDEKGHPLLRAGAGPGGGLMVPPQIPGMPRMPGPPAEFLTGGYSGSGLFRPLDPVVPFDHGNQVTQYTQR